MSTVARSAPSLLEVTLLERRGLGVAYHVLSFAVPAPVVARAGQFAMLRGADWGDAPLLPRPMSYLSAGSTPSVLIKVAGAGTARFARAQAGAAFTLLGPLGNTWSAPPPGVTPLLVAGGVGVAPLLFFARELVAAGVRPVTLYGGRSAADLPLVEQLEALGELHVTTEDGSRGLRGRVTEALGALLGPGAKVYTCGPDRMMAAVAAACEARGVPCEVSLETPMACGYGVCLGCPVPMRAGGYRYACSQGPCMDASLVDWVAPRGAGLAAAAVGGARR